MGIAMDNRQLIKLIPKQKKRYRKVYDRGATPHYGKCRCGDALPGWTLSGKCERCVAREPDAIVV